MHDPIEPEWHEDLEKMAPDEQRAYLRAILHRRVHCPRCPVKTPRLDREPCRGCVHLPDDLGRPSSTVN
jgi:hypothetical protein